MLPARALLWRHWALRVPLLIASGRICAFDKPASVVCFCGTARGRVCEINIKKRKKKNNIPCKPSYISSSHLASPSLAKTVVIHKVLGRFKARLNERKARSYGHQSNATFLHKSAISKIFWIVYRYSCFPAGVRLWRVYSRILNKYPLRHLSLHIHSHTYIYIYSSTNAGYLHFLFIQCMLYMHVNEPFLRFLFHSHLLFSWSHT